MWEIYFEGEGLWNSPGISIHHNPASDILGLSEHCEAERELTAIAEKRTTCDFGCVEIEELRNIRKMTEDGVADGDLYLSNKSKYIQLKMRTMVRDKTKCDTKDEACKVCPVLDLRHRKENGDKR